MTDSSVGIGEITDEQLVAQLRLARTIAIVGLSPKPDKASFRVATYLQRVGYRIIPVRPGMESLLGEPCFASLEEIPAEIIVDVVDVFRQAQDTPPLAEAATHRMNRQESGARLFWLQSGILNDDAMDIAQKGGLLAVQDRCLMVEHMRLAKFLS